jgi:lycopene cyclase domain-containing protein
MSYLQFHLVFILPVLVLLVLAVVRRRPPAQRYGAYFLMPVIALLYTTPWDNYLVWRQVWGYPQDRVLFRLGYVPVEEYLFFVLQPLVTGAFALLTVGEPPKGGPGIARVLGAGIWLLVAALGVLLVALSGHWLYLGLILGYFAPVFVLQWAYGGDLLWAWRRALLLCVLMPSGYLWLADLYALQEGIWWIAPQWTTGVKLLWLPLEEMLFFVCTNIAIVQGLLLAWHPASLQRLK